MRNIRDRGLWVAVCVAGIMMLPSTVFAEGKDQKFDGYLFFKLGAICTRSEGPDYFLVVLKLWGERRQITEAAISTMRCTLSDIATTLRGCCPVDFIILRQYPFWNVKPCG